MWVGMVSVVLVPKVIQAFGGKLASARICAVATETWVLAGKWNVRSWPLRWQWMMVECPLLCGSFVLSAVVVVGGCVVSGLRCLLPSRLRERFRS